MSARNVELVRRWFAGLARGDLSLEICDQDITLRNWDESPVPGDYQGHAGLQRWWAEFADAFEEVRIELKEATALDETRVVTTQHLVGTFRLTGIKLDGPFGAIITVRDGRILDVTGYASPGLAKKAAGLPRPPS
jgi:ketosteroid isomerase-like protein